jgi:putative spermidine/putrescine transport system permease protein
VTSLCALAAVDLKRTASGDFIGAPADERIFVQVLGRTFGIATAATVMCLLLGYLLAYLMLVVAEALRRRSELLRTGRPG